MQAPFSRTSLCISIFMLTGHTHPHVATLLRYVGQIAALPLELKRT